MRRISVFLPLAAAVLVLGACGPTPPAPPPTPTATVAPAPLFETDEEALAAAEAVYREYLQVSDSIAHDGGADPQRLRDLVTERRYAADVEYFEGMQARGTHLAGAVQLVSAELQSFSDEEVTIYACIDVAGARHVDQLGRDTTPPDRVDRLLLEVLLVVDERLLISRTEPWPASC